MEKELEGTYGSMKTPCTVLYYNGWYCVNGSKNVNRTHEELEDGVDVETISDYDYFSWSSKINTIEELIQAVES